MKRNLSRLANSPYDLLIIGGGIYGAFAAWEATLRGLSVALVEKQDFGGATSANSQKTIHGGFRYLQHLDFKRLRESVRERTILMRIAPDLVHPLPVLLPTYGHGIQGKEILRCALKLYDLLSLDRNVALEAQKHIPKGYILSKNEALRLLPLVPREGLTGGAVFHDAQVQNSERLILSILHSASKLGAELANYVQVVDFIQEKNHILGVEAKDHLTGQTFPIRAKMILNTSGPWTYRVLNLLEQYRNHTRFPLAKSINLVTRILFNKYGVGIYGKTQYQDQDAIFNKGTRLFFVTPWRNHSIIGTALSYYDQNPDDLKVTEDDVQQFMDDFNTACPGACLKRKEVTFVHRGFLPSPGNSGNGGDVQISKKYQLIDHRQDGLRGLISVVGVKYTTARDVIEKAIDLVFQILEIKGPPSQSSTTPLQAPPFQSTDSLTNLHPLKEQVLFGIREEMAQKLSDIILRRTDAGTAAHPGEKTVEFCAEVMGQELGWSTGKTEQEIQEVDETFSSIRSTQSSTPPSK